MEAQHRDPHTGLQIAHTNPMEKNRRPTNKLFVYFFILIIIAWLIACISGFRADQDKNNVHDRVDKIKKYVKSELNLDIYALPSRFSSYVMIFLLGGAILSLLYIFLSGKFTKFVIYFGSGLYLFLLIIGILLPQYLILRLLSLPSSVISFISLFSILIADKSIIYDILKQFYRIYNPIIVIFTCITSIIEFSILLFTVRALISYVSYSNDGESYFFICNCVIMVFGGTCVLYSIRNFAVMVISDYTINSYWENPSFKQSLARTFSNHMGTVIFSSIPILPFSCTLIQALKHTKSVKSDEFGLFYAVSKLSLVFDESCTALTFSSIYGISFIKSTQKMFDSLLKHSLLYLATIGVVDVLFSLNVVIVVIFGMIENPSIEEIVKSKNAKEISYEYESMMLSILCLGWYIIITISTPLLQSVKALLVNRIIILNKEDHGIESKTEILSHF